MNLNDFVAKMEAKQNNKKRSVSHDENDDMANERYYLEHSHYNNGGRDPFGRKLTDDERLMIGIIEE